MTTSKPSAGRGLAAFLATEAGGGTVLLAAAALALAWANSDWADSYESVWSYRAGIDLRAWVSEVLMTLFFFVVGLEIKRELVDGELSDRRRATLPLAAALGGMIVPALIYLSIARGAGSRGWGIPTATDIAFAVGLLSLLGSRLNRLKVLLLGIAIADDIGVIILITIFYSRSLDPLSFLTIAGAFAGLMMPVGRSDDEGLGRRLERVFHPWTAYAVVPLFALANAGVSLGGGALSGALSWRVALAVALGLFIGKAAGITAGAWIAVRSGIARLPEGCGWSDIFGVGLVAGVGFTVSLFVVGLAFPGGALAAPAKIGILAGSALSASAGLLWLGLRSRRGVAVGTVAPPR